MSTRKTISALTGVRGYAALWVVLYHYRFTLQLYIPDWPAVNTFIYAGYLGVDLFAFLSGFIISYTYSDRLSKFDLASTLQYLWLRFVRTYPLHLFVLFLFVLVFLKQRGVDSLWVLAYDASFVRQLFLLNGLGLEDQWTWNVPSWSLGSEWLCYLLFPFFAPFLGKVNNGRFALVMAVLSIALTAIILKALGFPRFDTFLEWGVLRIGGEFLAGCWLYRMYKAGIGNNKYIGLIGLAALFVFIVKSAFFPQLPVSITIMCFAILIYALTWDKGPLLFLFGNRFSIYLGEISFSIYMIHWFIIENAGILGFNSLDLNVRVWAVLLSIVVSSCLIYEIVEKRSRSFLRGKVTIKQSFVREYNKSVT